MAEDTVARSIGYHGHWGYSTGFDFLEAFHACQSQQTVEAASSGVEEVSQNGEGAVEHESGPLNILLIQPGDIRHILLTIARRRRHSPKVPEVNFYIYENPLQLITRELILLELLNDYEVPIRQRANVFLEIYGNNKVQKRTTQYIDKLSRALLTLSTQGKGRLDQIIDLSLLNYRERDEFESALKLYHSNVPYEMDNYFDHRQRALYADRFDSRNALFDWDYQSSIRKKASIVHFKQYKEWRNTGIAFEFGDQVYCDPNRTMVTYTEGFIKKGKEHGLKKEVKGFWGDIVASPYFSFGVDSDTPNTHAEGLYDILNKGTGTEQHRHHAVEVALYNLYSILWEIETGDIYRMTKAHDIYSGLGQQDRIVAETQQSNNATEDNADDEKLLPVIEAVDEEEEKEEEDGQEPAATATAATAEKEDAENITSNEDIGTSTAATESKDDNKSTLPPVPPDSASAVQQQQRRQYEVGVMRAIHRAECIVESYKGIKIIPVTGSLSGLVAKKKLHNTFDGIYVSSRSAQIVSDENFPKLWRSNNSAAGLLAMETAKFLVPLSKKTQEDFTKKEVELAEGAGCKRIQAPVFRRRRDEADNEDDVIFFQHSSV